MFNILGRSVLNIVLTREFPKAYTNTRFQNIRSTELNGKFVNEKWDSIKLRFDSCRKIPLNK